MAKQKFKKLGIVEPVNFDSNFKQDYYDYGMSVIKDRALPDVRDGLKPVQRAIIYAMLVDHITSKSKTVKVAKIVGNVIGKYHPHGDTAAEDALAAMSAQWKLPMPVIEIKGNNGSVFGDSHAAGRYIEAKLSKTGDAYGKNLKPGIVPYMPNFDETTKMPKVLPAQLPYLLINGDSGIAVGLASSIPPHNPVEAVKAFIRYAKNPNLSVKQLMRTLKGPDFPTAAQIINKSDLPEIYETGRGSIRVRGKMHYSKKDHALHVDEIPFNFSGSMNNLVDELATACLGNLNAKGKKSEPKIPGVLSVLDHSGKDGIDITIRLRKSADPEQIAQQIFAKTRMETTFKVDMSALNNKREKRYNLKSYFKEYLAFQNYIVNNEFAMQEKSLAARLEIIQGMLKLRDVLDEVVASAKLSSSKEELIEVLTTGKVLKGIKKSYEKTIKKFNFTPAQAKHIAGLPIYKLNRVDYDKLKREAYNIKIKLNYAQQVQHDPAMRKQIIIKRHTDELENLKGSEFKRKTELLDQKPTLASKIEIPESKLYFSVNKYNYLRLSEKKFEDSIQTTNKRRIGFIDEEGLCYNLFLDKTKPTSDAGVLIDGLVDSTKPIVGFTNYIDTSTKERPQYLLYVFETGNVKLTDAAKFMTKQHKAVIKSSKTSQKVIKAIDVPSKATQVTINESTFNLSNLSIQGPSGKGRKMIKPIQDGMISIKFS